MFTGTLNQLITVSKSLLARFIELFKHENNDNLYVSIYKNILKVDVS